MVPDCNTKLQIGCNFMLWNAAACKNREKGVLKSPQAFQNPKLKIIFPLMMRKAQRSAFQIVFQYELSPRLTSNA